MKLRVYFHFNSHSMLFHINDVVALSGLARSVSFVSMRMQTQVVRFVYTLLSLDEIESVDKLPQHRHLTISM